MERAALVGCGGIGYHLAEAVARNLKLGDELWLIDGDTVETKNLERQFFKGVVGMKKAHALAKIVSEKFPDVVVSTCDEYVAKRTLKSHEAKWLREDLTLWVCVDNDASRVFLQNIIKDFENVTAIFGGNGTTTGQAALYRRVEGKQVTPLIYEIAPEILHTDDHIPDGEHCLEHSVSEPQTALVNRAVALAMECLRNAGRAEKPVINEIRVNTETGVMAGFWRKPVVSKKPERKKKTKKEEKPYVAQQEDLHRP